MTSIQLSITKLAALNIVLMLIFIIGLILIGIPIYDYAIMRFVIAVCVSFSVGFPFIMNKMLTLTVDSKGVSQNIFPGIRLFIRWDRIQSVEGGGLVHLFKGVGPMEFVLVPSVTLLRDADVFLKCISEYGKGNRVMCDYLSKRTKMFSQHL